MTKSRRSRFKGHVALMGETRNHTETYSETMKTKKSLGRPRFRRENKPNIKLYFEV